MYKKLYFIFLLAVALPVLGWAQGGTWVWVNGPSGTNNAAVYGTMGVSSSNNAPTPVYEAANWIDKQGNFWIYGGVDSAYYENSDLWKYDPVANTWTWVWTGGGGYPSYGTKGIPSVNNNPSARSWGIASWTDANGDLWMYGGFSENHNLAFADLWRYHIATNEWTYMSGDTYDANTVYGTVGIAADSVFPGSLHECTSTWVDAQGNFWLFGGQYGYNEAFESSNDIWKYNPLTNQWAVLNGTGATGAQASYGTMGISSAGNEPYTRWSYTGWNDAAGNFYIFGGGNDDGFSDVWKYDPVTNLWTWIAGNQGIQNDNGNYTNYCIPTGITGPQGRFENRSPKQNGCIGKTEVIFGGFSNIANGALNDLWTFDLHALQFKWISGLQTINSTGNYGTKSIAAPANMPPARAGSCQWMDSNGNLFTFGGQANSNNTKLYCFSDMWKFIPDGICMPYNATGINALLQPPVICPGDTSTLTLSNDTDIRIWNGNTLIATDSTLKLWPDTTTTYYIAAASSCSSNDTSRITLTVNEPGILTYQISDTQLCKGSPALLTITGQSQITISPSNNVTMQDSSHYLLQPTQTTTYAVNGVSSACGFTDSAKITLTVRQYAPVHVLYADSLTCPNQEPLVTVTGLTNIFITGYTTYGTIQVYADSATIYFSPPLSGSTFYPVINGTTSCMSTYSDTIHEIWLSPNILGYGLSRTEICKGDSALLDLYSAKNISISPSSSITWFDSTHIMLHPDSTTVYQIRDSGICGGYQTASITLRVINPGVLSYYTQPPGLCLYDNYFDIYTFGLQSFTVNPSTGTTYYENLPDSNSAVTVFDAIDSASTFYVTGTDICGVHDSVLITANYLPPPGYTLSGDSVCPGDTILLTLNGIWDLNITPPGSYSYKDSSADSSHIFLFPDSTTYYYISGSTCNTLGITGNPFPLHIPIEVLNPTYQLYPTSSCGSGSFDLWITNVISVQANPAYSSISWYYPYNPDVWLYVDTTTNYEVITTGVCGNQDTADIKVTIIPTLAYILSQESLCPGDSVLLSVIGLTGQAHIVPSSSAHWIDTAHAWLFPDTTTSYRVYGSPLCGAPDTATFAVYTARTGQLNYTISQNVVCGYTPYFNLYIYGEKDVAIIPTLGDSITFRDSADTYARINISANTTYTVTGTNICGGFDTATFSVTYTPVASVNQSTQGICHGQADTVTIAGLTNLHLTPVSGATWVDSSHLLLSPDSTTYYTLTGMDCSGLSRGYSFPLFVLKSGMVNYTLGANPICPGRSTYLDIVGLSNIAIMPYVPYSYVIDSVSATATLRPDSTTTYFVSGTSACGGTDTAVITLVVRPVSAISINKTVLCKGDSAIVTIVGMNNISISPDTDVTWIDSTHFAVNPGSSGFINITADEICGYPYYYGNYIQVVSLVAAVLPADSTICNGDSAGICASPGFVTYNWNTGQHSGCITIGNAGNYIATVTDANGCTAVSAPVQINVSTPSVSLSAGDTALCMDDSTRVCATAGFTAYHWGTGQTTQCIEAWAQGNYYITATDANGCSAVSTPVHISVLADTVLAVAQHNDTLVANSGTDLQWYFNGTPITGATGHAYIVTQIGTYEVTGTSNCGAKDSASVKLSVGIVPLATDKAISIYPNPATDQLYIKTENIQPVSITVYDVNGRIIYTMSFKNEIDINALSSGVYFVEVKSNEGVARKMFVKM